MPVLAVNVDHVATLRQARLGKEPDPVTAAHICELAGAEAIIMHLREDRRHVQDRDVTLYSQSIQTRFHLEMAATEEMQSIALKYKPHMVCLVPEKREELTTEGGLDVASRVDELRDYLAPLHEKGIKASLFIDADPAQIEASAEIGAEFIEIHTGHYADASTNAAMHIELESILSGISRAQDNGLKVNLGHGLNYHNIIAFKDVPGIQEYSIGHSIISRAVLTGLQEAVNRMSTIVTGFAD